MWSRRGRNSKLHQKTVGGVAEDNENTLLRRAFFCSTSPLMIALNEGSSPPKGKEEEERERERREHETEINVPAS